MSLFNTIILGLVEGLTEFLPVSSTFHLIITSKLIGMAESDFLKFFEVFIQSGGILAAVVLFWSDLIHRKDLYKKLFLSFLPVAVLGLLFYKVIKDVFFESTFLMILVFFIVGLLFIAFELFLTKKLNKDKDIEAINYKDAFLIGLFQAFALLPGVSRAGAVMLGMMSIGYKRSQSAKYSFLLAIPTIFAASAYDLLKTATSVNLTFENWVYLVIGFIVAFLSALVIMKWFINFLKGHSLIIFGIYRIVVGGLMFILF